MGTGLATVTTKVWYLSRPNILSTVARVPHAKRNDKGEGEFANSADAGGDNPGGSAKA